MIGGIDPDLFIRYVTNSEYVKCIPSKTLREYLESDDYYSSIKLNDNEENWGWNSYPLWSCMQIASLLYQIMNKESIVSDLQYLAANEESIKEKNMIEMCAADLMREENGNSFSAETIEFFNRQLFEQHGPALPLEELMFFPVIFTPGDVVTTPEHTGVESRYYLVLRCPDYDGGLFYDISDESYTVVDLEGNDELLNETGRLKWHSHILPVFLDYVANESIPNQYRSVVDKMRTTVIKERNKPTNQMSSGVHSKEEMRERIECAVNRSTYSNITSQQNNCECTLSNI